MKNSRTSEKFILFVTVVGGNLRLGSNREHDVLADCHFAEEHDSQVMEAA
jgi:hypothetical protein